VKNKKKSLHENLENKSFKKKYLERIVETKEAEKEIKDFDRLENIEHENNTRKDKRLT
jgi:hypothetical protein